jgi:hypothetical protein
VYLLLEAPANAMLSWYPLEQSLTADTAVKESAESEEDVLPVEETFPADTDLKFKGQAVGHIYDRLEYWMKNFHPDDYVRGVLAQGLRIPVDWSKIPEQYEEPDNRSAKDNYEFVREEVARLVESGQVVEWPRKPRCVNPFTAAVKAKADGQVKKRLCLDLSRSVNEALDDDVFCMSTLQDAINMTRRGDYQVIFDLKAAFHHKRIHPDC